MIICLSLLSTEVVFTPKVVKAAQGCVPVFLDVGVRHGIDGFKALIW